MTILKVAPDVMNGNRNMCNQLWWQMLTDQVVLEIEKSYGKLVYGIVNLVAMNDHRGRSRGLFNVMNSWARQTPPHLVCIVMFVSIHFSHHAACLNVQSPWWSLLIRARSQTTCSGDFLSALHFILGLGWLGFTGYSLKRRELTPERKRERTEFFCVLSILASYT